MGARARRRTRSGSHRRAASTGTYQARPAGGAIGRSTAATAVELDGERRGVARAERRPRQCDRLRALLGRSRAPSVLAVPGP